MRCNNRAWLEAMRPSERHDLILAMALAERVMALAPEVPGLLNTLATVYYRLGWHRQAIAALERNLRETEVPAMDLFLLASCHAKLGEKTEARDCYDRAVRWTEAHADQLLPILIEDLGTLRAEAKRLLDIREK